MNAYLDAWAGFGGYQGRVVDTSLYQPQLSPISTAATFFFLGGWGVEAASMAWTADNTNKLKTCNIMKNWLSSVHLYHWGANVCQLK